jgi:hypothetical protein
MSDLEVREAIRDYIAGNVDARVLEDRLEDVAWDTPADPARKLTDDALRLLAEQANGDWTESELREQLGVLTRTYWFEQAPKVVTGTSSTVIRQRVETGVAERLHVGESV